MEQKLSAYKGCLLGLAVGDAMGYPVDKKTWDEISGMYGPNGLLGYDLANGSADNTSYTQLAAFVYNGLLLGAIRGKPENYGKFIALSLRDWAKSQQFWGATEKTFCWVAQVPEMRRRHCMDTSMLDALRRETLGTPEKPVFRSAFPGALTAAVAVGLAAEPGKMTGEQIGRLGAEAVAITHGDPEAFLSGSFVAYVIAGILQEPTAKLPDIFCKVCDLLEQQYSERYPQVQTVVGGVKRAMSLTKDAELSPLAAMTLLGCTTAAECVAGAVYASTIHMANFDEAMIVSVNHSGRSGCVGALTGAIMGAKLGVEALPDFYLESLETTAVLSELAKDFTQVRQVMKIFDDSWDQKYVQGLPVG